MLILLVQVPLPHNVVYVDQLIIWLCIVKWVVVLQDVSDQVNYVNDIHSRATNNPSASRLENHPNFSYKSNAPLMP